MAKKSKGGGGGKKVGQGSKKLKSSDKGKGQGKSGRTESRREARDRPGRPVRRAHGKEDAVEETRQRLRAKLLQRQLQRGPGARPGPERRRALLELAQFQAEGRQKLAIQSLQEALDIAPEDEDFKVRSQLLALYMDRAMTEEAASLLKGPLFTEVMQGSCPPDAAWDAKHEAMTVGCYSLAVLSYISTRVLREHRKPKAVQEAEERLQARLRAAHKQNPFVAEFLAFAPAFESVFPFACELPPEGKGVEVQLLEALRYCCQLGGRGQAPVWLDTDSAVRRWVREELFEEDTDAPPLAALPPNAGGAGGEGAVLGRWRRARQSAMELWAAEMQQEAGLLQEEACEEEQSFTDDDVLDDG